MHGRPRIAIFGGPKSGKSMLARRLVKEYGGHVMRTEGLLSLGYEWSELAERCQSWVRIPGPWVIEGLTVPRVLRRWLAENPGELPVDMIYNLGTHAWTPITKGQRASGTATMTVWSEVEAMLRERFTGYTYDQTRDVFHVYAREKQCAR